LVVVVEVYSKKMEYSLVSRTDSYISNLKSTKFGSEIWQFCFSRHDLVTLIMGCDKHLDRLLLKLRHEMRSIRRAMIYDCNRHYSLIFLICFHHGRLWLLITYFGRVHLAQIYMRERLERSITRLEIATIQYSYRFAISLSIVWCESMFLALQRRN
jgi:hypothetical protein